MGNLPEVSVFMPVYNGARYIKDAIKSILDQSFYDLELIIIDDGYTDNTSEIIKEINDKRIRFFSNDTNKGLPYTRNKGLKLCRGKYIAFMDADDISHQERIKTQICHFYQHPYLDVISCTKENIPSKQINPCNLVTREFTLPQKIELYFRRNLTNIYAPPNSSIMLLFRCMIVNPGSMIKKSFITKNNIRYRNEYFVAQDYSFWMDCMIKGANFKILQNPLLYYRTDDDYESITNISKKFKSKERKKLISSIRARGLKDTNIMDNSGELKAFNDFFQERKFIVDKSNVKLLKKTLKTLKINNKIKNVFPSKNFNYVLQINWINQIVNSPYLSRKQKLFTIFFSYWFSKNPKVYIYMLLRIVRS